MTDEKPIGIIGKREIDLTPKAMPEVEYTHIIHLKKKTIKEPSRYFIVTKAREKRAVCEFQPAVMHVIGFWTADRDDNGKDCVIKEVWIPYENIDHVEGLVYRQRG